MTNSSLLRQHGTLSYLGDPYWIPTEKSSLCLLVSSNLEAARRSDSATRFTGIHQLGTFPAVLRLLIEI